VRLEIADYPIPNLSRSRYIIIQSRQADNFSKRAIVTLTIILLPKVIAPFLIKLLDKLSDQAVESFKSAKEFKQIQSVANERISRELFWNNECLSYADNNVNLSYLGLIRTTAFDELVSTGVPLDLIFSQTIDFSGDGEAIGKHQPPRAYAVRLKEIKNLSMLIDRTYHRLWMLQKRCELNLAKGDVAYARALVRLTSKYVSEQRHSNK